MADIQPIKILTTMEAFENMKADPEYRAKIMSALQRDLTSSFAPLKASLLITVGASRFLPEPSGSIDKPVSLD